MNKGEPPDLVRIFFDRETNRYRNDFWSQLEAADYRRRQRRTALVLAAVLFILLMINTAFILNLMDIL